MQQIQFIVTIPLNKDTEYARQKAREKIRDRLRIKRTWKVSEVVPEETV